MKRRHFLKTALGASAAATLTPMALAGAEPKTTGNREYYELRAYHLQAGADHSLLDDYLAKAAIPALNRLGCKPVGAFTEIEPKGAPSLYVLIPYPSLEAYAGVVARLAADADYQKAGVDYLGVPKASPAFQRIDSWFLLAFEGMPKIELPAYAREKKPRIFELRTYESYSEAKAAKKVEMFNSGEIDIMHELAMGPIFYGQGLIGSDLPHLTYMLSAENREAHQQHWKAFGGHPTWKKMSKDPQYADTVSKISNHFLSPTDYSQI